VSLVVLLPPSVLLVEFVILLFGIVGIVVVFVRFYYGGVGPIFYPGY